MYEAIVQPAIAACSLVVGMVVQYYLSRVARREDTARDKRLESYSSYVAGVCRFALINRNDKEETNSARIALATAKSQISIYGSDEVVRALANFERNPSLKTREATTAFLNAIEAMRADGRITNVSGDELHWLIFSEPLQQAGSENPIS